MGLGRRFFLSTIKKEVGLPFISTWRTTNTSTGSSTSTQVKLPLINSGTYNFVVNWGDGNSDTITTWNQAETTHTYASSGDYTITITGQIEGFSFLGTGDRLKILDIQNWGSALFLANSNQNLGCFYLCSNLNVSATDNLSLNSGPHNSFFRNCTSLIGNSSFNNWDMSGVTSFTRFFEGCTTFNQAIGNWNVSNSVSFVYFLNGCTQFNQDVGAWNIGSATNISGMFRFCTAFNNGGSSSINGWNTSNVTVMGGVNLGIFESCTNFNQPIGNWDISGVTSLNSVFRSATNFNQDISSWVTSQVTNMGFTFSANNSFSSTGIGSWDVSGVTSFGQCFLNNGSFNLNIGSWNLVSATNLGGMFQGATSFNNGGSDSIKDWNVSGVTNFSSGLNAGMFTGCIEFNQPIGSWNVSAGIDFRSMFQSATNFNQNIGSWNVAKASVLTNFMANKTAANYSAANLDSIYNGWSLLTFVNTGLSISFGTIKYTAAGQAGRDILTDPPNNWAITDGGI